MLEDKRKLDELIAIYCLEKELVDIYVEGPTDKFIIENYFEYRNRKNSVIEIDDLDVSHLSDKLIALTRILKENNIEANIKCIVDKDFDGILGELEDNAFLFYTDYSCLESYFLCRNHIDKLLSFGIKNYPLNTDFVIEQIGNVLSGIFRVRMVNKHFGFNFTLPKVDNNMPVNKKTGLCSFNFENYLDIYINSNGIRNRRNEINEFILSMDTKLDEDVRFQMNGHDFIEVLFNYINKTKNTVNFRLENFERTFYLSVQPNHLDEYSMFKKLCK